MTYRTMFAWFTLASVTAESAHAQFSSDIPGVPRASISMRGGHQSRTEWALSGYRIPRSGESTDKVNAVGVRLGFGSSYRVRGRFEIGYDFTLVDLLGVFPPTEEEGASTPATEQYLRALAGYGIRLGGKFRPIASLDLDGNGYEVAVGAAWRPGLKPITGAERLGDSTRSGGQFAKSDDDEAPSTHFPNDPFAKQSAATTFAVMGSYRARRFMADAAIVVERVAGRTLSDGDSPVGEYDGVSLNGGGSYRLTPSIAFGGSFWGQGTPPWRDDIVVGRPGTSVAQKFAFMFQFGSAPESGVDLMLTSPTGKFSESVRLYIRARSTR